MNPDSDKKEMKSLPSTDINNSDERDRQYAITAIGHLFSITRPSTRPILYFGSGIDDPKCISLYASFAMLRSDIEPIVKRENVKAVYYENYLSYITNMHLNITDKLRPEAVVERYVDTTNHTEFLIRVIQHISEKAQGRSLSALIDIVEMFPAHTLSYHKDTQAITRYVAEENIHKNVHPLLEAWFPILSERIADIINAKRETNPNYSPYDLFQSVVKLINRFPTRSIITIAASLQELVQNSEAVGGLILSLEIDEVIRQFPTSSSGRSLIPQYAKSLQAFWSRLNSKPDFQRMPLLVSYFSSHLVLISNRRTHPEMTKKAEIIDSITPKQFGISSISDALWHGPQEQGIDNRAHFLEKMGNFSTDLEDVQETLSWLDIMEFPYDSSQAKSGVLSGFSVIHLRVNEDVESYKRVVGLNLGQIASLPHSFYRALTTYPLGIHHEGEIQPGDAGDFTKSRVLTLLAERGMYYTLTDRLLNTALINNQLAAVEMPYERIFNYINWAFDEFSCIQFGRELNAYIGKNGIDGDYRSSIHEIDSFVQSLGAMLYLLKDASVRNEGHEPGEITSGQHDITISVLENILSENISNWERLQRYHKNKLVRIATGFIVSAFPVGHACEVTRFSTQKLYAADLNRRNETGEPNTSKESGFEANQSSSKKCHYSLTR